MKLDGMKCPYCGKVNTHAYKVDKVCIWDDEFYECMKKEFGENRLKSGSSDNVIYRCHCNECEKYFSAMVEMEISVKNIVLMDSTSELLGLKVKGMVCC